MVPGEALEPHLSSARLAQAERIAGQRGPGVEQRLPAALDLDAALHVFKGEQLRDAGMVERAPCESGSARPARPGPRQFGARRTDPF